ncbi:MAG: glucose-1-phosphate adenylyltransferase subunit GlgD, partial [Clostridia bacterium]|nr:glucose-1-phosphate adenylyltransferase subunit GlgD [Clostridia bacterium]
MKGSNIMGIVFANKHDHLIRELTASRAMGSVPFGGRYRLIDFSISNMVNANISKVGVVTNANYHSLMDHVGTGKAFDLARKKGGLYILPPNLYKAGNAPCSSLEQLIGIRNFIASADEEYVYICEADVVSNFDLKKMYRNHLSSGADITIGSINGEAPSGDDVMELKADESGKITEILISPEAKKDCLWSLG